MFTLQECAGEREREREREREKKVTDEETKGENSAKNILKAQTREHFSKPST